MARINESALQQEIMSWMKQNQYAYLATSDKKQARVRPVVLFSISDQYYFVTFSGDAKVAQIQGNKLVEVCIPLSEDGHTGYIRLSGSARIIRDPAIKAEALDYSFFFDHYFQGYDDPDYTLVSFEPDYAEYLRPGENHKQGCNLKR